MKLVAYLVAAHPLKSVQMSKIALRRTLFCATFCELILNNSVFQGIRVSRVNQHPWCSKHCGTGPPREIKSGSPLSVDEGKSGGRGRALYACNNFRIASTALKHYKPLNDVYLNDNMKIMNFCLTIMHQRVKKIIIMIMHAFSNTVVAPTSI